MGRLKFPIAIPSILVLALLLGCQTTMGDGSANPQTGASEPDYNLFWDQGDHLKELVEAKKFGEAADLYGKHKPFFAEKEEKYIPTLRIAADGLNQQEEPRLARALSAVDAIAFRPPQIEWPAARKALTNAESLHAKYLTNPLLSENLYRSSVADELARKLSAARKRLDLNAIEAFKEFDHFGKKSFFELYPVDLGEKRFLNKHFATLSGRLEHAPSARIEAFARNYPKQKIPEATWGAISDMHLAAKLRELTNGKPDLPTILRAVSGSRQAGFEPKSLAGTEIAFVEVTSPTLLKEGQIEFPAKIEVDLPFRTVKAELGDALKESSKSDYLVIFDVALAKARRRISEVRKARSKYVARFKTVPNPDYSVAQAAVNKAQIDLQQANMNAMSTSAQYCYGLGCLGKAIAQVAHAAVQASARKELDKAVNALGTTPMTLEKPVYQPYSFDKAEVKGTKTMTVHYYVIDRPSRRYFKSTFDVVEKKTFNVAYSVHDDDPDKNRHLTSGDTEADVLAWEEAPSSVSLSQLTAHYLAAAGTAKRLGGTVALKKEMLRDKNRALAKYNAKNFEAQPRNDPRFKSVVVVFAREKKSLGTGFFIKPDVVLTNWHVVENATFVELKTHDKQETFGKVIARDARLDLALIKVQSRGEPVHFYDKKTIDLGNTVEAIGHPRGLEFSITRGVVSALRRHKTINVGRSGKSILFVQTDAPINPGNSGGPLFLGDRVIGVNSWGLSKQIAEGLGFAVHFSEVLEFVKENLSEFRTSGLDGS